VSRIAPRRLSSALEDLTAGLAPATTLARVQKIWEQAVGVAVAQAGRPTTEHDGVLTVSCADSVWAAELDLMGPELVRSLNRALGDERIDRLRCRVG
jgi:predicted nucleic acid-binding Zn ribbon protein